ncbi:MAG: hypothetical protein ABSH56_06695 [Bryobacteraceae bacterium]|jgi:hypothetical protein
MKPKQEKIPTSGVDARSSPATTAMVVHELNNLLTLVLGYGQLIVDGTKRADPNRHSAEQVLKAGERAAVLTRQMAEAARQDQIRAPRVRVAAGHGTSEKSSPPVPGSSRHAARRS